MKKVLLLSMCIFVSCHFFPLNKEQPPENNEGISVSRHGITWILDGEYETGTFVNGDYWVAAGDKEIKVLRITCEASPEVSKVGSTLNPRFASHGYCERSAGYDPGKAVKLPLTVKAGDSLVSARVYKETTNNTDLYSAAVLTIVDKPVPATRFRPPYTRNTRTAESETAPLIFNSENINWNYIPSLTPPAGNIPDPDQVKEGFDQVWLDHMDTHWVGIIHPFKSFPAYGRDISSRVSVAICSLMLDYTREEKEPLLYDLIQTGIDYYGIVTDGGQWQADGGHKSGRKFPIVFASVMLDSAEM